MVEFKRKGGSAKLFYESVKRTMEDLQIFNNATREDVMNLDDAAGV